ncbi:acetyl-CoA carboxylase biotin carboxyl carrier protein [Actinokineospora sp.]|uniref:acetyl-CoA carboxylase biotin carboxyl carrier protein n=1 Tax=Actinokineospora sp. TaxID=1872133 RepID=UPI003D6ABE27
MTLSPTDIKHVLAALQESEWDEAVITVDDVTISVARNGAVLQPVGTTPATAASPAPQADMPAPAPAASTAPVTAEQATPASAPRDDEVVVSAPSVGIFWRSPQPGAPPFVEVGSHVEPGDTLCIIEVMKLMSNVAAEVSGTVTAVHLENAVQVEFGTPLISIVPDAT